MISKSEQDFLDNYNIKEYERPSIATDIVVFSVLADEDKNYRKLPEQKLKLLLIKRGTYPFLGEWALPGGFAKPTETITQTAARELEEETHISRAYMELIDVFSEQGRDPRGWIISNTYLALMDEAKCNLREGDDAWEAHWFDIQFIKEKEAKEFNNKDVVKVTTLYSLKLNYKEVNLECELKESKVYKEYHESVEYKMLNSGGLAFDHAKIIVCALKKLREQVRNDGRIAFNLMPEYFTLTQLQKVFELILDEEMLTANFRRKIANYVIETDKTLGGAGHRPAKLFRRNIGAFYRE